MTTIIKLDKFNYESRYRPTNRKLDKYNNKIQY